VTIAQTINAQARRVPTWVVYLLGVLPFVWLVYQLFYGSGLGVDPVKEIEHRLGTWALRFLVGGLAMTPLLRLTRVNLIRFRRAIGLLAFFYVSMHFTTWFVLDMGLLWSEIAKDLVKRWYIVIGMTALVLLIPMALTSNNWSVRKLGGANWRRLHKAVYLIVLLATTHNIMAQKVWEVQPMLYLAATIALLAIRLPWRRWRAASSARVRA